MKIERKNTKFINGKERMSIEVYEHMLEIYNIAVSVSFSRKNIDKYSEFFAIDKQSNTDAFCAEWLNTHNEIVMFFKSNPNASTIAHEATHAADWILQKLKYRFVSVDNDVSEINAYLVGHLVKVVNKAKYMNKL